MKRLLVGGVIVLSACAPSKEDAVVRGGDASADAGNGPAGDGAPDDDDAPNVDAADRPDARVPGANDAAASHVDSPDAALSDGRTGALASDPSETVATSSSLPNEAGTTTDETPEDNADASSAGAPFVTFTFDGAVYTAPADGSTEPENVSVRIERTGGSDRWLVPSPSGAVFALSSARADDEAEILVRANADFSVITPVLAGGSPVYLEGMPAILDNGETIIFSASGGTHARDLFVTHEINGSWTTPEELTQNSDAEYNNQPSLTRDQTAVLFNCGQYPDPESGNNSGCRVQLGGGTVDTVASPDTFPNNRNSYVNFPREITGGVVFESAWPQGEDSPETIWQTLEGTTTPALARTFDNSVSPCVLPDDSLVLLWLGRPGGDGAHELTRVYADGSYVVLWDGVDVDDIGIGCTSRH